MHARRVAAVCTLAVLAGLPVLAGGAEPQRRSTVRPAPRPASPTREAAPAPTRQPATPPPVAAFTDDAVPTEATLGFPIYPNAVFLTSYDAGRGQRYYLFGTNSAFEEMVRYYTVVLDERGDRVFDAPGTHIFEIGRFREDEMAFPPGVTVKDYTWNGSDGYLYPVGGTPARFKTIIQIVPAPAGQTQR